MPYAANDAISRDPIRGGIEITDEQYAVGLDALLAGHSITIDGGFSVGPAVEQAPSDDPESNQPALQDYDNALMGLFDSVAQSMGYRGWETCALRAHRPGPFEAEGTAFYVWMESCNVKGYQILADVTGGHRTQPTIEQFLSEMPAFERPQ